MKIYSSDFEKYGKKVGIQETGLMRYIPYKLNVYITKDNKLTLKRGFTTKLYQVLMDTKDTRYEEKNIKLKNKYPQIKEKIYVIEEEYMPHKDINL